MDFDYERLQRELDAEYRIAEYNAKSETLRWVRDKLQGKVVSDPAKTSVQKSAENGSGTMGIRGLIREALKYLPEKFNKDEIVANIAERHAVRALEINPNSMRSILFKMVQDEELEPITRGGGTALTIYRRGKKAVNV